MRKRHRRPFLILLLAVNVGLVGCTSVPKSAEQEGEDSAVIADAPLGSRIKRRNEASPVSQAVRQQYEQERVKMGAIQSGIVNSPK